MKNITKRNGKLSIEAVAAPTASLDALLRKITPHNRHAEASWGAPRGKEVW